MLAIREPNQDGLWNMPPTKEEVRRSQARVYVRRIDSLDLLLTSAGNNCGRGGFICEGYANKVPWPKNGVQKPHPPLQARDRLPVDPAQLYHRCA